MSNQPYSPPYLRMINDSWPFPPLVMTAADNLRVLLGNMMVSITFSVYCFSVVANIMVVLVFFKDGLKSTTNLNFFALGVSDLLTSAMWIPTVMSGHMYMSMVLDYTFVGYISTYVIPCLEALNTIGSWITTIIIWERLCCVVFPLKVKRIFSRTHILCLILGAVVYEVIVMSVYFVGEFLATKGWLEYTPSLDSFDFVPSRNLVIGTKMLSITSMARSYIPNYVMYALITIGTALLVIMYVRSVHTRKAMLGEKGEKTLSRRDIKVIQSAIAVCVVYIVTCSPKNVYDTMSNLGYIIRNPVFPPDMFTNMMKSLNHAVNIFLYLAINSNFRKQFRSLFCRCCDEGRQTRKQGI